MDKKFVSRSDSDIVLTNLPKLLQSIQDNLEIYKTPQGKEVELGTNTAQIIKKGKEVVDKIKAKDKSVMLRLPPCNEGMVLKGCDEFDESIKSIENCGKLSCLGIIYHGRYTFTYKWNKYKDRFSLSIYKETDEDQYFARKTLFVSDLNVVLFNTLEKRVEILHLQSTNLDAVFTSFGSATTANTDQCMGGQYIYNWP